MVASWVNARVRTSGTCNSHDIFAPGFAPNRASASMIYSGRRTPAVQAELFAEAVVKYGSQDAARQFVAPSDGIVCSSKHCAGLAADLAFDAGPAAWAHKNADRYGLVFPMNYEPWHIEPKGSRTT